MDKGDTVIELLAVIIILSLLTLITGGFIVNTLKNSKEKLSTIQINSIKLAAEGWARENIDDLYVDDCILISVADLEEFGFIDSIDRTNYPNIDDYFAKVCLNNNNGNIQIVTDIVEHHIDYECFETEDVTDGIAITGYSTSCPKDVIIPSKIDNKNVVEIGDYAFSEYSLTSIVLPQKIKIIGQDAFSMNSINKVSFPAFLEEVEPRAFYHNELTSVNMPNKLSVIGAGSFGFNQIISISFSNQLSIISENAFSANQLVELNIPNNILTIEDHAFDYNKLTSVTIGSGITTIGKWAFANHSYPNLMYGPNDLQSVLINTSQSAVSINNEAFLGFSGTIQFAG